MQVVSPKLAEFWIMPSDLIAKQDVLVKKAKAVVGGCAGAVNRHGDFVSQVARISDLGESQI
jgi:hypothetical protein